MVSKKDGPAEVLTMCDGYRPVADANRLLRRLGLRLVLTKRSVRGDGEAGGDQRWLHLEKL